MSGRRGTKETNQKGAAVFLEKGSWEMFRYQIAGLRNKHIAFPAVNPTAYVLNYSTQILFMETTGGSEVSLHTCLVLAARTLVWPNHMHALRDALLEHVREYQAWADVYCCRSYQGTLGGLIARVVVQRLFLKSFFDGAQLAISPLSPPLLLAYPSMRPSS